MRLLRNFILSIFLVFTAVVLYASVFNISQISVANVGTFAGKSAILSGGIASLAILWFVIGIIKKTKFYTNVLSIIIPFVFLVVGQLFVALKLEIMPFTDEARIQIQAFRLLDDKKPEWMDYFSYYPNNVSTPIIYSWFYRVFEFLHIPRDYWVISTHILQLVLLVTAFLTVTLVIRRKNQLLATSFAMLVATSFPIYMLVLPTYTDPLVIIMLLFVFAIILTGKFEKQSTQFILIGLLLGVSYVVKQNALLGFVAFIILLVIHARLNWKKKLIGIVITVISFSVVYVSQPNLAKLYGYETKSELVIPRTNWIMMGLNPNTSGQIESNDAFAFTNLKDKQAKQELGIQEIKRRVKNFGVKGLIEHSYDKLLLQYSRGAMDSSSVNTVYTNGKPFYADKAYFLPVNFSQFVYVAMLTFSIFGTIIYMRRNEFDNGLMLSTLFILGIAAFHILFWEVEARYAQITLPFILYSAAYGLSASANANVVTNSRKKSIYLVAVAGLATIVAVGLHRGLWPLSSEPRILQGKIYGSPMVPYMENNSIQLQPGDQLSFNIKKRITKSENIFLNPMLNPDPANYIDFKNLDTGKLLDETNLKNDNGSVQMPLKRSGKGYQVIVKNTTDKPMTIFYYLQSGTFKPDEDTTGIVLNNKKQVDVKFMYYLYSEKQTELISKSDVVTTMLIGSGALLITGVAYVLLKKKE